MSKGKHDQVDMLHGPLLGKLILFALPLALSSILQQLFNAVDIAVLGQFATSQDQAAVGCTSAVINMFLNLFLGISVGANVVIATYIGQRDKEKVQASVHTAMLIALISGFVMMLVGFVTARPSWSATSLSTASSPKNSSPPRHTESCPARARLV